MKRWAALTVLLYALALLLLTVPVLLLTFGGWAKNGGSIGWQNALKTYSYLGYWIWLAVLVGGQALLLLLPIHIAERRLPARRPLEAARYCHRVFPGQSFRCRSFFHPVRHIAGRGFQFV